MNAISKWRQDGQHSRPLQLFYPGSIHAARKLGKVSLKWRPANDRFASNAEDPSKSAARRVHP
jgi:hypothetical protein